MTHRETGYAQILLTVIFLVGYFVVLTAFLKGKAIVDPTWKDTIQTLLGVLSSGVLMVMSYWFQRQRVSSDLEKRAPALSPSSNEAEGARI